MTPLEALRALRIHSDATASDFARPALEYLERLYGAGPKSETERLRCNPPGGFGL